MNTKPLHPMIQAAVDDLDAMFAEQFAKMDAEDRRWGWGKYSDKARDDAREVWAEMTAEMRAHEAGE